jgi:hypothetical protein
MNNTIKKLLLAVGLILIGYGIYTLIAPEASVSFGGFSVEAQDNTNAYTTLAFGLVALVASFVLGKKQ